jgi:hypothetical protein
VDSLAVAVRTELRRLRHGQSLAHPQTCLDLSDSLRQRLIGVSDQDPAAALAVVDAVRRAAARLSPSDRHLVEVELNLDPDHALPTLTERQESLAAELRCAAKTVRRRSERAMTALALVVAASDGDAPSATGAGRPDENALQRFWRLDRTAAVDVVCSEIPTEELPPYARPGDRNYLRYAKFADLDTLMFVRTRLAQLAPSAPVRDFAPSEHHETDAAAVIVIGGPPWNAKYREFMPQLPYHFEPHLLGQDDPLVVPLLMGDPIGPRWTPRGELIDDVGVFTRLTLTSGTTVFLLGGCLTAGVLGAARTFLHGDVGASNVRWIEDRFGDDDVVVVVETRRFAGMTDATRITDDGPLLALHRANGATAFEVAEDNTGRR